MESTARDPRWCANTDAHAHAHAHGGHARWWEQGVGAATLAEGWCATTGVRGAARRCTYTEQSRARLRRTSRHAKAAKRHVGRAEGSPAADTWRTTSTTTATTTTTTTEGTAPEALR